MTILRAVLAELWKMFVADIRLTLATLGWVAATGLALAARAVSPHGAAALLTGGIVVILAAVVLTGPGRRR